MNMLELPTVTEVTTANSSVRQKSQSSSTSSTVANIGPSTLGFIASSPLKSAIPSSWFVSPTRESMPDGILPTCRKEIEDCASRLNGAAKEARDSASAVRGAQEVANQLEAHMRLMQAQVEAAVLASTKPNNRSVPSLVLSIELQTLLDRTRVVEESLRSAHSTLKEAQTAHYWCKGRLDVLQQRKQELEESFLDALVGKSSKFEQDPTPDFGPETRNVCVSTVCRRGAADAASEASPVSVEHRDAGRASTSCELRTGSGVGAVGRSCSRAEGSVGSCEEDDRAILQQDVSPALSVLFAHLRPRVIRGREALTPHPPPPEGTPEPCGEAAEEPPMSPLDPAVSNLVAQESNEPKWCTTPQKETRDTEAGLAITRVPKSTTSVRVCLVTLRIGANAESPLLHLSPLSTLKDSSPARIISAQGDIDAEDYEGNKTDGGVYSLWQCLEADEGCLRMLRRNAETHPLPWQEKVTSRVDLSAAAEETVESTATAPSAEEAEAEGELITVNMNIREKLGVVLDTHGSVLSARGQALESGVRVGWEFLEVAGLRVSDEVTFRKALVVAKKLASPSEGGDPEQNAWPFLLLRNSAHPSPQPPRAQVPSTPPPSSCEWVMVSEIGGGGVGGDLCELDVIVGVNGVCLVGMAFDDATARLEAATPPLTLDVVRRHRYLPGDDDDDDNDCECGTFASSETSRRHLQTSGGAQGALTGCSHSSSSSSSSRSSSRAQSREDLSSSSIGLANVIFSGGKSRPRVHNGARAEGEAIIANADNEEVEGHVSSDEIDDSYHDGGAGNNTGMVLARSSSIDMQGVASRGGSALRTDRCRVHAYTGTGAVTSAGEDKESLQSELARRSDNGGSESVAWGAEEGSNSARDQQGSAKPLEIGRRRVDRLALAEELKDAYGRGGGGGAGDHRSARVLLTPSLRHVAGGNKGNYTQQAAGSRRSDSNTLAVEELGGVGHEMETSDADDEETTKSDSERLHELLHEIDDLSDDDDSIDVDDDGGAALPNFDCLSALGDLEDEGKGEAATASTSSVGGVGEENDSRHRRIGRRGQQQALFTAQTAAVDTATDSATSAAAAATAAAVAAIAAATGVSLEVGGRTDEDGFDESDVAAVTIMGFERSWAVHAFRAIQQQHQDSGGLVSNGDSERRDAAVDFIMDNIESMDKVAVGGSPSLSPIESQTSPTLGSDGADSGDAGGTSARAGCNNSGGGCSANAERCISSAGGDIKNMSVNSSDLRSIIDTVAEHKNGVKGRTRSDSLSSLAGDDRVRTLRKKWEVESALSSDIGSGGCGDEGNVGFRDGFHRGREEASLANEGLGKQFRAARSGCHLVSPLFEQSQSMNQAAAMATSAASLAAAVAAATKAATAATAAASAAVEAKKTHPPAHKTLVLSSIPSSPTTNGEKQGAGGTGSGGGSEGTAVLPNTIEVPASVTSTATSVAPQAAPAKPAAGANPPKVDEAVKTDPALDKYRKMLKMGISKDAVAQKMIMDSVDPVRLGLGAPEDKDPALVKYKKMLQMGISKDAVAQKMIMDGLEPKRLNLKPPADQQGTKQSHSAKTAALKKAQAKKAQPKRRKLHWETIKGDVVQLKGRGSIWHTLNPGSNNATIDALGAAATGDAGVGNEAGKKVEGRELLHDFEALFVAAPSPKSEGGDGGGASGSKAKKKQKSVAHVIDAQRVMNGGILLARMTEKSPAALAARLLKLDASGFTTEQLEALHSLLPSHKEAALLRRFKGPADSLSVCEQTMLCLLSVPQASERLEALVFVRTLKPATEFLRAQACTVLRACAALKSSQKLRRVFQIVLLLGNRLNHGGEAGSVGGGGGGGEVSPRAEQKKSFADQGGAAAQAFTLRSLLNLASTKAFDGRTTVLEYLVRVLERDEVLDFMVGLEQPVREASKVGMAAAHTEMRRLEAGKDRVAALVLTAVEEQQAWRVHRRVPGSEGGQPEEKFTVPSPLIGADSNLFKEQGRGASKLNLTASAAVGGLFLERAQQSAEGVAVVLRTSPRSPPPDPLTSFSPAAKSASNEMAATTNSPSSNLWLGNISKGPARLRRTNGGSDSEAKGKHDGAQDKGASAPSSPNVWLGDISKGPARLRRTHGDSDSEAKGKHDGAQGKGASAPPSPNVWLGDISKGPARLRRTHGGSDSEAKGKHDGAQGKEASASLVLRRYTQGRDGEKEGVAEEEEDPYAAVIGLSAFVEEAEDVLKITSGELCAARLAFNDLLDYFCEDPELGVSDFFTVFHGFFCAFSDTRGKHERRKAQEEREARVRAAQQTAGVSAKKPSFSVKKRPASASKIFADAIAASSAAMASMKSLREGAQSGSTEPASLS